MDKSVTANKALLEYRDSHNRSAPIIDYALICNRSSTMNESAEEFNERLQDNSSIKSRDYLFLHLDDMLDLLRFLQPYLYEDIIDYEIIDEAKPKVTKNPKIKAAFY